MRGTAPPGCRAGSVCHAKRAPSRGGGISGRGPDRVRVLAGVEEQQLSYCRVDDGAVGTELGDARCRRVAGHDELPSRLWTAVGELQQPLDGIAVHVAGVWGAHALHVAAQRDARVGAQVDVLVRQAPA